MSLDWILLGLRILAAVILYTFLGVAFLVIWRDLKTSEQERPLAKSQKVDQLRVIAAAGDDVLVVGATVPLQPVTLLGRDAENTVVLADAAISPRHARLSRKNGRWWLEALDNQNRTLLNNLLLSKPTALTDGDIIGIGGFFFRLETTSLNPTTG